MSDKDDNIIRPGEERWKKGRIIAPPPPSIVTPKRIIKRRQPIDASSLTDDEFQSFVNQRIKTPAFKNEISRQKAVEDTVQKDVDIMARYREKPLLFWRDELGIPIDVWKDDKPPKDWTPGDGLPLWSKQRDIIQALVKHRKVAVKSGHGVGKTFLAAGLALYFGFVWHATGMTTAPTFRQVRRALWGEIHYLYNRAKNPLGGKLNQVSLDLGDKWFIEGFATDKPTDNITGIHEENIFVIVDEAAGCLPETFEALDALLTSENAFVLYIGNPVSTDGPFVDAFKPGSGFETFTISCYDCPNVKHDRIIYSKLTNKRWVDDKVKKWGVHSNLFKIRVLGEFAEESKDTMIPIKYIDLALKKGTDGSIQPRKIWAFGLDVARQGTDSSVYGAKYTTNSKETLFRILDATNKKRETETAGKMKVLYNQEVPDFKNRNLIKLNEKIKKAVNSEEETYDEDRGWPPINVDEINVGGGVVDILVEDEYPVNGINVSEKPNPADIEMSKIFLNKRAQYYWFLAKEFTDEKVAIEDEDLALELSKFKVEYLRSGKVKIIDKDKIKEELNGRSPDRAEAMMLAYSEDVAMEDRDLVRFI